MVGHLSQELSVLWVLVVVRYMSSLPWFMETGETHWSWEQEFILQCIIRI
jgi:hypothetical protein